jgi:DNA polymerase-3 subunit beta
MKFEVSSAELNSRLQAIAKVINAKNSLPILDCFLFDLQDEVLKMTASDLESTIVTSIEVKNVTGKGKVAVQSKLLLDTLSKFAEQNLTFTIDDSNLAMVINSDNGKYNFIGQSGEDYPEMPEMSDETRFLNISAALLGAGISKSLFATGNDDLRPVMNGIFFDILPDSLVMVATDAHKLVKYKAIHESASQPDPEIENDKISFILPPKPASLLKSILGRESEAKVNFDTKNISVVTENYSLICRQIEGKYPNYEVVIPKSSEYSIEIDREQLLNALRRVQVFSNQGNNLVKLEFSNNILHISAQDIDFSTSADETIACNFDGPALGIGFKSPFLVEMLANIGAAQVELRLNDPTRAGLILPLENHPDEEIVMLLMPMLLND